MKLLPSRWGAKAKGSALAEHGRSAALSLPPGVAERSRHTHDCALGLLAREHGMAVEMDAAPPTNPPYLLDLEPAQVCRLIGGPLVEMQFSREVRMLVPIGKEGATTSRLARWGQGTHLVPASLQQALQNNGATVAGG